MSPKGDQNSLLSSVVLPKTSHKTNVLLLKLDETAAQRMFQLGVECVDGEVIKRSDYESLRRNSAFSTTDFDIVFSYVFHLLKTAIKHRSKFTPETLKRQLSDNSQLNPQLSDLLANLVFSRTSKSVASLSVPRPPSCKYVKWRIDVLISNDYLAKIMEPVIIFEVTLDNDHRFCFECNLAKFNQLRFAVASMLKVVNNFEEKTVIRLS